MASGLKNESMVSLGFFAGSPFDDRALRRGIVQPRYLFHATSRWSRERAGFTGRSRRLATVNVFHLFLGMMDERATQNRALSLPLVATPDTEGGQGSRE